MDQYLISRIIHAAQAGRLTEQQYELYLKLLEKDPDFQSLIEWEEFLDIYLPAVKDSELYEASSKIEFPGRKQIIRNMNYAIAAGLALILVSGWVLYSLSGNANRQPALLAHATLKLYSGDTTANDQLGYASGLLPIDVKTITYWQNKKQIPRVSYQFCSDTLNLFFKETSDTIGFSDRYRFTYFSDSRQYYLVSVDKELLKLTVCIGIPEPLLR